MKSKMIYGFVIGLLFVGAVLILRTKKECLCEEEGMECCCGY